MPNCKKCNTEFEVTDADREFYKMISPEFVGKKYPIPEPTFCPDCRQQRRLSWRNERNLYWRKCDSSGNRILSVFSPNLPYVVYDAEYWWSDEWSPLDYGRDFDFSRPFFEQFEELLKSVPQLSRSVAGNVNSDFVNQFGFSKNCYLSFEGGFNEDCLYSNLINNCKSCMDSLVIFRSELCFECIDVSNCYGIKNSQNCNNCSDSVFLKNCVGCKHCFGCVDLKNREYYFFNEPLTKETYKEKVNAINLGKFSEYEYWGKKFSTFAKQFPCKYLTGLNNEDSTGDYLQNTQHCFDCYDVIDGQDCRYIGFAHGIRNVYDMNVFGGSEQITEFCYEVHEIGNNVRNVLFCDQCFTNVHDLIYCKTCVNGSNNLFGCIGLKHAKYCVLNKQYSKEDYEKLVPKIIEHMKSTGEWGEFFPASISPFGYNETIAQEHYPLAKEEVLKNGFKWNDYEKEPPKVEKVIPADMLPDSTQDVPDDVLSWAIECEVTKKPFKLVAQELKFYRDYNLPIPRRHPDQRHKNRMTMRNPRHLWDRKCDKCSVAIQTTYSPDRLEKVYCEHCYLKEVY